MDEFRPGIRRRSTRGSKRGRVISLDDLDVNDIKFEDASYNQRDLVDIVNTGNATSVEQFLIQNPTIDFSHDRNYTRLLLRTAIEFDNADVLEALINHGIRIGGALFTAVGRGSKACVIKILALCNRATGDLGPEDIKRGGFVSPLIMAVLYEEYEVVDLMVSKGYRVKLPECIATDDSDPATVFVSLEGHGTEDEESLSSFRSLRSTKERDVMLRVYSYKALASPIYICYSYIHNKLDVHPLFHVFRMNEKLQRQARLDPEFKEGYCELSEACEQFTVDLLDQCRTMRELKILTDVMQEIHDSFKKSEKKHIQVFNKDAEELTVLNLAIKNNTDKVVAHPYSQLRLNMVLYRNIYRIFSFEPEWRDRGDFSRVVFSIRHVLLLPLLSLIHILLPHSLISKRLSNPVIKFMSHTASFYVFVILLVLSSFQDMYDDNVTSPTIVEWIIVVWVTGILFQEVREIFLEGVQRYVQQWWNVTAMIMVILFFLSFILRLIAYGITGNWGVLDPLVNSLGSWYQFTLVANSLFSLAMVLSFIRLSGVFQVNGVLGPLQLSLYHLVIDVLKFLVFFVLIFMAFGFSLRRLYSHYISTQKYIARNRNAARNASTNGTSADTNHQFSDVGAGLYSLFWSVFGLTDLTSFKTKDKNFAITKETGEVLFGFFQVLAVIVAVNMLIAMMTRSFDHIAEDAEMQWKVSRTRLWMNWVQKGSGCLPPPFNLIPNPFLIFRGIRQFCSWLVSCSCRKDSRSSAYRDDHVSQLNGHVNEGIAMESMSKKKVGRTQKEIDRREVIKRILRRYLHMKKYEEWREEGDLLRDIKGTQENILREMVREEADTKF